MATAVIRSDNCGDVRKFSFVFLRPFFLDPLGSSSMIVSITNFWNSFLRFPFVAELEKVRVISRKRPAHFDS
jgi:hypothetical protein